MSDDLPQPTGGAHLRTVALPRDANASGDIFGGWTLSQMDLAGGTFAAAHSGKRPNLGTEKVGPNGGFWVSLT